MRTNADKLCLGVLYLLSVAFILLTPFLLFVLLLGIIFGEVHMTQVVQDYRLLAIMLAPFFLGFGMMIIYALLHLVKLISYSQNLCYIPATLEEIDALGLKTVNEYFMKIAEITNTTKGLFLHKLFAKNGVTGIKVTSRQAEKIKDTVRVVYNMEERCDDDFYSMLELLPRVKKIEQVENLTNYYLRKV